MVLRVGSGWFRGESGEKAKRGKINYVITSITDTISEFGHVFLILFEIYYLKEKVLGDPGTKPEPRF